MIITKTFAAATGIKLSTLGTRVVGNDRFFSGLLAGLDCKASSLEIASDYFDVNWPIWIRWPDEVRRNPLPPPPGRRRRRRTADDAAGVPGPE